MSVTTKKAPNIVTQLPGPEATKVIEADERWVSKSYTRAYPFVVKRGYGAVLDRPDAMNARPGAHRANARYCTAPTP